MTQPLGCEIDVTQVSDPNRFMRRIVIFLSCLVAIFLVGVIALVAWHDPVAEVNAVRKCFEQMPNVRVTYISDLTKQASQTITADIEVSGKGEMSFTGLDTGSFRDSSRIRLSGIGAYGFRTRGLVKGQEFRGFDVEIGAASPIPAARHMRITNIQSAVAHYDELLALVAHWPVTTNDWPKTSDEEIHFADLSGGDYYFCLKR